MIHLLFVPIETSQIAKIRPNDKKGLVLAERILGHQFAEAIDNGVLKEGEVLNRELIRKTEFNPSGTSDGIRDAESNFSQWGWAYWKDE